MKIWDKYSLILFYLERNILSIYEEKEYDLI